jgi:hypothetical protein
MKFRSIAAMVFAGCITLPAHAVQPTYSYLEAAYIHGELGSGNSSLDTEGVRVAASVSLQRWLNFLGEYEYRKLDKIGDISSDVRFGTLGVGVHSMNRGLQVIGALTYEWQDFNASSPTLGSGSSRDEGYGVLVGGRLPLGRFDLQADYKYVDFGKENGVKSDDSRIRLIGMFHLTEAISVVGSFQTYEDAELDEFMLGFRVHFTNQYDRIRRFPD